MEFLLQANFIDDEIKERFLGVFEKYYTETNYVSGFALAIMLIHCGKYKESIGFFNLF